MLILDRREGEEIFVGDITVVWLGTVRNGPRRGQARIGIEAPDDVLILRAELEEKEVEG